MNPFDQPPTDPPVSFDPPSGGDGHGAPRRGRMALAALAAAGLVGGGIVVAGQLASADEAAPAAAGEPAPDEPADEPTGEPSREPSIDGEIVIDDGDGEPFVLDLGKIGECLGPIFGDGRMFGQDGPMGDGPMFGDEFEQRMEEFLDGLGIDEMHELDDGVRIFGSGGSTITVVGPDGAQIIDLGEGDATVTIEQSDGELTIDTEGDATVGELPDLGELVPGLDLGELNLGDLDLGQLSDLLPFDPDAIESCLDDLD